MDYNNQQQNEQPHAIEHEYIEGGSVNGGNKKNIIMIVIAVVLILTAIALAIFLVMKIIKKPKDTATTTSTGAAIVTQAVKDTYKKDKDFDGISDVDEKKLGTSNTSIDTDEDGLTDDAEINRYKTDPKKADTDGDGLSDGFEIRRGLDPKKAN